MAAYDLADNPLNKIEWAFAAMECVHIASLALSIGTIAIVDMSLLGQGLKGQNPAKLLRGTELWTMAGLVTVIVPVWRFLQRILCATTTAPLFV
jgi:hypothetical protein